MSLVQIQSPRPDFTRSFATDLQSFKEEGRATRVRPFGFCGLPARANALPIRIGILQVMDTNKVKIAPRKFCCSKCHQERTLHYWPSGSGPACESWACPSCYTIGKALEPGYDVVATGSI